jgi:hypothetical protein
MASTGSVNPLIKSMSQYGLVTKVISPLIFESTLTNFDENFFQDWDIYVVRKGTGSGFAPQGDKVSCASYVSATGRFTQDSVFDTSPLTVGDEIYLMHPFLGNNVNILDQASNNLKQIDITVSTTSALVPALTKVKELAFTGKIGSARIKFDMKVSVAGGTAYGVIFKNGVPVTTNAAATPPYTINTETTGVYQTFTQDVGGLVVGDLIQVYAAVNNPALVASVMNFNICYDLLHIPSVDATIEKVYMDSINGVAGTARPIGTREQPCNNWADTLAIAKLRNLSSIQLVHGVITLTADTTNLAFFGNSFSDPLQLYAENCIQLNGFVMSTCSFESINIDNNSTGVPNMGSLVACGSFRNCALINAFLIQYCHAFYYCIRIVAAMVDTCYAFGNCGQILVNIIADSFGFENVSDIDGNAMTECYGFSNVAFFFVTMRNVFQIRQGQMVMPEAIDFTGYPGAYAIFNFNVSAPITLVNLTSPAAVLEFSGDYVLTIDGTCTAGVINVHGNITLIDNHGIGCTVNDYTTAGAVAANAAVITAIFNLVNAELVTQETGGTVTPTGPGVEDDIYINNAPAGVFEPLVLLIDFSNQTFTESTTVRLRYRIAPAGGMILEDEVVFAGVQNPPLKSIELHPNRYGIQTSIENTAGALVAYNWEVVRRS